MHEEGKERVLCNVSFISNYIPFVCNADTEDSWRRTAEKKNFVAIMFLLCRLQTPNSILAPHRLLPPRNPGYPEISTRGPLAGPSDTLPHPVCGNGRGGTPAWSGPPFHQSMPACASSTRRRWVLTLSSGSVPFSFASSPPSLSFKFWIFFSEAKKKMALDGSSSFYP